jgi:hypothetical protein
MHVDLWRWYCRQWTMGWLVVASGGRVGALAPGLRMVENGAGPAGMKVLVSNIGSGGCG